MIEKYSLLFKNTLVFTLGNVGSKIISFLLVPLYTHYLTTTEYGIADLVFTLAQILVPILTLMVSSGLFRYGLSNDYRPEDVLCSSLVICIPGIVIMPFISFVLKLYEPITEWVWYLCLYVICQICSSLLLCYLKVKELNKQYALLSVLQTFLIAVLNIITIVIFKWGIRGYLFSSIVSSAFVALVSFFVGKIKIDIKKSHFDKKLTIVVALYSAPLVLNELSWWIIHSCDKLMITHLIGSDCLGVYSIASRIPSFITVIVSIFSSAWGISTIKEYEETTDNTFYNSVFKAYSFINFLAAIMIISIVKIFMKVYVSDVFFEAWRYTPFLILSTVYASFCSFFGALYTALKKSISCMYSSLVGALINVLLNYYLIKGMGLLGAVIASAIACLISTIIRMRFVRINLRVTADLRFLLNNLLLVFQTITVSLDWNQYICSALVIVLFIVINMEYVQRTIEIIRKKQ